MLEITMPKIQNRYLWIGGALCLIVAGLIVELFAPHGTPWELRLPCLSLR
jgi:hypothetical protein